MMPGNLYNPLDIESIAESLVRKVQDRPCDPLPPPAPFFGAGVYIMYYRGSFPDYVLLARENETGCNRPIYIGKADPRGGRVGVAGNNESGQELYGRLVEHGASIEATINLDLKDFACRYLPIEHLFISLAEYTLINLYKPVWNYFGGFGNHDPGSGRYSQRRSAWDTVHPGRAWAAKLQDNNHDAVYWGIKFREHIGKAEQGAAQPIPLVEDGPTELNPEE